MFRSFFRIRTLSSRLGLSIRLERVLSTDDCPFVTIFDVCLPVPFERSLIDSSSTWSLPSWLFLASRLFSPFLVMRGKGEYSTWEKEKELDIPRFLTTIERVSVGEEERSKVTMGAGNRGGRGERVKACTGSKDHEKFLEIGLYGGEAGERGIEGGR